MKINKAIEELLNRKGTAHVSTSSKDGLPNTSLKGIVRVDPSGYIYVMDLFNGKTRHNLEKNNKVSLTISDIEAFRGYQFKGTAKLIKKGRLFEELSERWAAISARAVTERVIGNIKKGSSHGRHELHLPKPKYLIKIHVSKIYDLCPIWIRILKPREVTA